MFAYNEKGEFVKKYNTISEFCKEHKIDPKEAIDVLNKYFERRRKENA